MQLLASSKLRTWIVLNVGKGTEGWDGWGCFDFFDLHRFLRSHSGPIESGDQPLIHHFAL